MHISRRRSPHSFLLITCILALLAAMLVAAPARGQGTMGMLPEPISSQELDGYMKRLQLSPQQQHAARAMHDQYKREFRALREGEIAEFLKVVFANSGQEMPSRKVIEDVFKGMEDLNKKIATVDNRFIDQLQPILTEPQLLLLPRTKLARERAREYSQQMMWMAGQPPADLSAIALDVQMTPDDRALADSVLSGYETKLTGVIRELREVTMKMMFGMYDQMEGMGVTEETMNDPEQAEKMGEAMETMWRDMAKKPMELSAQIDSLNRRTAKSIMAMLPEQTGRDLRNRFYARSYSGTEFAMPSEAGNFDAALASEELTPEQRETVLAARSEFRQRMDSVLEDAVSSVVESRASMSPFDFDSAAMEQHQKQLQELREKATTIAQASSEALEAAVGPEFAKKLNLVHIAGAGEWNEETAAAEAQAMAAAEAQAAQQTQELEQQWSGDQFLPGQINRRAVEEYATLLGLNEEQKAIALELHAAYVDAFKAVREKEIQAVTEASQSMWNYDEGAGVTRGPEPGKIDAVYKLRATAMDAIAAADVSFFDNLELILEKEQPGKMKRVRVARERERYNVGNQWGYWMGGGSSESSIDLAQLLRGQKLPDETLAAVDEVIAGYGEKAAKSFKERYEAQLVASREQEIFSAEMMRVQQESADGEGGGTFAAATRFQERMRDVQKRLGEANSAIGTLNRETLAALLPRLSGEAGETLRGEYNKQAFPHVYNDVGSPQRALENALKLEDLNAEQQRRLGEIAAEFRPAYAALCDQMVEASTGSEAQSYMMGAETQDWQKWMERQEKMAKMMFDRNELNAGAVSKLRALLSDDQITRIGGLPEPQEDNPFDMW